MPSTSETTLRNPNSEDLFSRLDDLRHIKTACGAYVAHVAQNNCATLTETPKEKSGGASATAPQAPVAHLWRSTRSFSSQGGFNGNEEKFKKSVLEELSEVDGVIAELTDGIRNLEAILRPKVDLIRQAEAAIGRTVEGGLRLSDRALRRPHYARILEIRAAYGGRFEELKELKRRVKAAVNLRNHLSNQKGAQRGKS